MMSSHSFLTDMVPPPRSLTKPGFFSTPRLISSARPTEQLAESSQEDMFDLHLISFWSLVSWFTLTKVSHSGSDPRYGGCLTSLVVKGNGKNSIGSSSSAMFCTSSFSLSDNVSHSASAQSRRGSKTTVMKTCQQE